jgi:4-cresol dehydrogenase (hydroxylating)
VGLDPTSFDQALAAWRELLGAGRCVAGPDPLLRAYARDVGEFSPRLVPAVLRPESTAEVQGLIRIASAHRIALHAFSTGKSWGLGSRQPVRDDCVAIDLSRMNRIRTIDLDEGTVIVEPGVTQHALSEALAGTRFIANLTASTPDTSLVGNVIDKGIGLHRHRVDDLLGFEVVTGYGEVVQVGGYWPTGRTAFHFASGLGPTLTSLFLQSNFAVITACALRLIARPEEVRILHATVTVDRLSSALSVLADLRATHALTTVIKLYNGHAFRAYSGEPGSPADDRTFHLVAAVHGRRRWVEHVGPFIDDTLRRAECFDDIALLAADALEHAPALVQALARTLTGTPTEFAVQRALGLPDADACRDVDAAAQRGFLFIIPVVPVSPEAIGSVLDVLGRHSERFAIPINATINILSEHCVEMVCSVRFARVPDEIRHAHRLKRSLLAELAARDVPLMRLDIDAQDAAAAAFEPAYRDLLVRLKRLFDPSGIIAPGRYLPES